MTQTLRTLLVGIIFNIACDTNLKDIAVRKKIPMLFVISIYNVSA